MMKKSTLTQLKEIPSQGYEHRYAVIVAGGAGTRLWPMSRKHMPKQFQRLVGSQTLLQQMYQLIREVLVPSHVFVQVDKRFRNLVLDQLPELPHENILVEPEARDTGPACGFAAAAVMKRDPDAHVGLFWSDHLVKNRTDFVNALLTAFQAAEDYPKYVVSIGIKPTYASTALGYIQMKRQAKAYTEGQVFYVKRFIEKPDQKTADRFIKGWEYLWNTGYAVFNVQGFFKLLEGINKETADIFLTISKLYGEKDSDKKITALFDKLPRISIDYMVWEKLKDLLVVPSDMEWSDIGDWKALHSMLSEMNGHHMVTKGHHIGLQCEGCLVYAGERMIATLGLKDVVVVDTGDVVLIADRHCAQDVKKLVKHLEAHDKHTYL